MSQYDWENHGGKIARSSNNLNENENENENKNEIFSSSSSSVLMVAHF